jgi:CheY-like chemotaxis protein
MSKPSNPKMNTLRLGKRDLQELLEIFDRSQSDSAQPDREFLRWSYRVDAVEIILEHNSDLKVSLPVATRNISRGGISILHSSYIHTGISCDVLLNLPGGTTQTIPGKVVRCSHIAGRVHEVGIAFHEQISTKELLGLDPIDEAYSLERVDPDRLHGSILVVTSTDLDREIILNILEDTNLAISSADNIADAVSRAQKGCDLVLADYHLNDKNGAQLIAGLRSSGSDMPVVIMTSDKSDAVFDSIRMSRAAGTLSKPVSRDRVYQALAEFLHADGDGGPLYTKLDNEDPAYPLLGKFLTDITRIALDLEKGLRDNNAESCQSIFRMLTGTASPLGFPLISSLAIDAEKKLASHGFKGSSNEIRAVVVACRRIKNRPAA